ncbi:MAG: hypothetical protein ACYCV8_05420 [bacterium]
MKNEKNKKGKNWKKKKTPAAQQLSKFKGERKVKVFKHFFHLGLCELRRQRIKNWHKEFKRGDLTITMQAPESLNMYDKGILLAILVLFAEKADELKTAVFNNNPEKMSEKKKELIARKGKPDKKRKDDYDFDVFRFAQVQVDFNKFCRDYAGVRPDHKKNVLDSIQRWLSAKTIYRDDVEKKFYAFHYLIDFCRENNIVKFTVSQQLLDSCNNGLILAYDIFQSINTEIGKMLYLFLLGNINTVFSYKSLKSAFGLADEDKYNRELIKQGFTALHEKEILSEFRIENRVNDSYYTVTYGRLLKENQEKQPFINNNIVNMANYKALPDSHHDGDQTNHDGDQTNHDGDQTNHDGDQGIEII